jgi:hypothetical protein
MLSKCANPPCRSSFRYLHQGKLYRFEIELVDKTRGPLSSIRRSHHEYFWLCDACSSVMTLSYDRDTGVRPIPLRTLSAAS